MTLPDCPTCKQFGGKVPGYVYGSNWDFVPCQDCDGTGKVSICHDLTHYRLSDGRYVPGCSCGWWSPSGSHAAFERHKRRAEAVEP